MISKCSIGDQGQVNSHIDNRTSIRLSSSHWPVLLMVELSKGRESFRIMVQLLNDLGPEIRQCTGRQALGVEVDHVGTFVHHSGLVDE